MFKGGSEIREIAQTERLFGFTDALVDQLLVRAVNDSEPIIAILAKSVVSRRPPKLIWHKRTFENRKETKDFKIFVNDCRLSLKDFIDKKGLHPGQFLICSLKPLGFESRGALVSKEEAKKLADSEREEMIQVFESEESVEPVDIVDLEHGLLHKIGSLVFRTYRLYMVSAKPAEQKLFPELKALVMDWC